jgi:hypothetical protein
MIKQKSAAGVSDRGVKQSDEQAKMRHRRGAWPDSERPEELESGHPRCRAGLILFAFRGSGGSTRTRKIAGELLRNWVIESADDSSI